MDQQLFQAYHDIERLHWWTRARRTIVEQVLERHVPSGASVLDVGCGTGYVLEDLQARYEVWGIDPSPLALRYAREKGLTRVAAGTPEAPGDFGGERFDAILLLDVLEHLEDDAGALAHLSRLLRPGGHLLLTVPAHPFLWSNHDVVNHHKRRYVRSQLERLLKTAGLDIVQLSYFNCFLFPLAIAARLFSLLSGKDDGLRELVVPPRWLNALLHRIFAAESVPLAWAGAKGGLPWGLSLLAVVQVPATPRLEAERRVPAAAALAPDAPLAVE